MRLRRPGFLPPSARFRLPSPTFGAQRAEEAEAEVVEVAEVEAEVEAVACAADFQPAENKAIELVNKKKKKKAKLR